MSECFERGMKIFREKLAGMYDNGHMTKWADVDTSVDLDRLQRAHDHELEQARKAEYARGYENGRRSKDADHAAVAIRLSNLRFDGGSHENLSKIAYAIYPCATGWTCESSKGLRDRLIDLLGGVHEHRCDAGRSCARGDSHACGVGEPTEAMTYDVLGNERHKAVCRLREWEPDEDGMPRRELWEAVMGEELPTVPLKGDAELDIIMRDRLIYLLGGDEPTAMEYIQRIVREHDIKCLDMELSGAELSQASVNAVRVVRASGVVGNCRCSSCNWRIDPVDLFCRRCGKELVGTIYERGE